jgi:predicted 2-oxoglutarate/Fe(II)-dependent dioxygenase YbiX
MLGGMNAIQKTPLARDDQIFTLSDVLSTEECARLIRRAEHIGFADAPITVGVNRFAMAPEIRNNLRVMVDDPDEASRLWARIEAFVPPVWDDLRAVGLNERLRYYRYEPGQYFRWHRDGAFVRSERERSLLTVMLYLNEDMVGGTTDFMDDDLQIVPRQGMALVFEHPLRHQGAPVLGGKKYVLRTDVMYARRS